MRKRISALLICILLLVSSAGCGGDTPSQPAASAEAPTEQRTTLTMFSFDEGMKDILQDSTIFQKLMENNKEAIPKASSREAMERQCGKGEFVSLVMADTDEYRRSHDTRAVKKTPFNSIMAQSSGRKGKCTFLANSPTGFKRVPSP